MSLPVKIGNYRFERNLGNGTFGKVKCKCFKLVLQFLRLFLSADQAEIFYATVLTK